MLKLKSKTYNIKLKYFKIENIVTKTRVKSCTDKNENNLRVRIGFQQQVKLIIGDNNQK